MKKILFLALAFSSIFVTSCKKDKGEWKAGDTGSLSIDFDNRWGDHNLVLGQEETTASGEKATISTLKYYISNIVLTNEDGSKYTVPQDESYFLVDESVTGGTEVELENIPAGNYTAVTFMLGVDSLRNTMDVGQRLGALDVAGVASDMYWAWNSGYIFYKIEGTSPSSTEAGNNFWYHIGGFGGMNSPTFNNLKTVTIDAEDHAAGEEHANAEVRTDVHPEFHLYVDASKLFSGTTTLKIADYPFVMFAPYSVDIAKNFVGMFALDHIHND